MKTKKALRIVLAIALTLTFMLSLSFSSNAEGELTYSEAVAAFKADMADPTHIDSVSSAYLYCVSTETVLLSFDASPDVREAPADTAKLLTALTAYDLIDALSEEDIETDLATKVRITQKMINESPGSRYGYKNGDYATYSDLICTMLMRNADDSATALAYTLCGNMIDFAHKMNEKAAEIGMTSSTFTNATGAHDDRMKTTARDIFILSNEFYKNEKLMSYVGSRYIRLDAGNLVFSNNYLVSEYYNSTGKDYRDSSVNGMIVGRSAAEGDVIVRSANYNGYEYICVVLGAKRDGHLLYSYEVSNELIKWGSKNYSFLNLLSTKTPVASMPVKSARETDTVPLVPSENLSKFMLTNAYTSGRLTKEVTLNVEGLKAPVAAGTEVGEIALYFDGELIAKSTLRTAFELTENTTSSMIVSFWEIISSKKAISTYIALAACVSLYVLINSIIRHRRKIKREGAA